jgi:hypothetical protein
MQHFAGDFYNHSSPEERLAAAQSATVRAEVRQLGKVRDAEVLDLTFFLDNNKTPSWKSIVVRKAPGSYCEIYQVEPNSGAVLPSYLIPLGSNDVIIAAKDDCQRYGCTEGFFRSNRMAPVRLDFTPVFEAAGKACPRDVAVWEGYGNLSVALPRGFIRVGTRDSWGKPSSDGVVEVRFKVRAGRFAISRARYLPDVAYEW